MNAPDPSGIRLVRLGPDTLRALLDGDLDSASEHAGVMLTPYFVDHAWLWQIRVDQIAMDPDSADWIARAAVEESSGDVVGHVGFHGGPDDAGMVEVAYSVDPRHRRRGLGTRLLAAALQWAQANPEARVVRASVSPENAASLATVRQFDFRPVGEQWDEEDGLELLFELDLVTLRGEAPSR